MSLQPLLFSRVTDFENMFYYGNMSRAVNDKADLFDVIWLFSTFKDLFNGSLKRNLDRRKKKRQKKKKQVNSLTTAMSSFPSD